MKQAVVGAVVLGVLGLAALGGGVYLLTAADVGCGLRVIQSGDVCESALRP